MAERGLPKQAQQLSKLLEKHQEWKQAVGSTMVAIRKAGGWTQSSLAEELSISQGYVSQIENGDRTPSSKVLLRLHQLTEGARDGNEDEGKE